MTGGGPGIAARVGYFHLPSNSRLGSRWAPAEAPSTCCSVFIDRDGVLVEDVHFLREPGQLRVLPGVPQALRLLQDWFYLMVVTNQSGIARGFLTEEGLLAIHAELVRRLSVEGVVVDGFYYCPHLPEAPVATYRVQCDCRKPRPGMLVRAGEEWGIDLANSFLVGDRPRDLEAARAAGVQGIPMGDGFAGRSPATPVARDLLAAARFILAAASPLAGAPGGRQHRPSGLPSGRPVPAPGRPRQGGTG